ILTDVKNAARLEKYIRADLDRGLSDAQAELAGKKFDRILLQDVLEHLRFPEKLLRDCRDLLTPQGQLLVSLPNVANITVRLLLLMGRFDYTERGILDKTHLRFFTRRTARRMLEENGFEIISEKTTVMPVELVLGLAYDNPFMRILNGWLALLTKLFPNLFGYQHIFVIVPKEEAIAR